MAIKTIHEYTPDDDAAIRIAWSFPIRTRERKEAMRALMLALQVSEQALRSRAFILRCRDTGKVIPSHEARREKAESRTQKEVSLPTDRPSWMKPITREQLMGRR